ncbi:LysR family transcriptional regulator [Janthinobacterium sp. GW460P]|uniref:LysR family transcriptional regulator n=1 Tax=unclassified Janthinobacterium TaxID=2610881 RepID=UPI000A31FEA3|nr:MULTISPECIES: LysR family transcriptional regulator [unclassified Janthinobacterium]MCC7703024.1 LysR family transcriptional regulator [Janthinobacterium sp. GW460P]MCC7708531.1 LysR family transcriptional regulator [Janthinobacterium sp. GW460W]
MVNTLKDLELRHFRCVLAVAHSLHFARAAAELGISPPALTKQVQETEQLLGTRLFQRSKRAVSLTAAGELFVLEAARALEQLAQAQDVARRAGRGELGRLEIGYVASAAYSGVLQSQFARFRASHPGIHISAREYAMDALPGLLDQGRVDLAFVRPPLHLPDGLDSVVLLRDRFVLAVQADSPLARQEIAGPAALAQQAFIVPEQELGTLEASRRGGFAAQVVSRPGSLVAVLTEVSLGVGCAIVPHSVMASVQLPGVVFRELEGPQISSEIAVAFRRHEQAPAARAFIAQLRAAALA